MIKIALHRTASQYVACFDVRQLGQGDISHGLQDKSPDFRRGHVVGWIECFAYPTTGTCWRSDPKAQWIQCPRSRRQQFRGRRAP